MIPNPCDAAARERIVVVVVILRRAPLDRGGCCCTAAAAAGRRCAGQSQPQAGPRARQVRIDRSVPGTKTVQNARVRARGSEGVSGSGVGSRESGWLSVVEEVRWRAREWWLRWPSLGRPGRGCIASGGSARCAVRLRYCGRS